MARVTLTEYAREHGVTRGAIKRAVRAGHIERFAGGLIDRDAANATWGAAHRGRLQGQRGQAAEDNRFIRAKIAAGIARTQLARHRYAAMVASLVDRDEFRAALVSEVASAVAIIGHPPDDDAVTAFAPLAGLEPDQVAAILTQYTALASAEFGDPQREASAALDRGVGQSGEGKRYFSPR